MDTDLVRLAILLYLVLLPGGAAILMILGMVAEGLERRRIRKILRRD